MYNIIGRRKTFYLISAVFILVGLVSLTVRGLNLGIDFTSVLIQMEFEGGGDSEIEEVLGSRKQLNSGYPSSQCASMAAGGLQWSVNPISARLRTT